MKLSARILFSQYLTFKQGRSVLADDETKEIVAGFEEVWPEMRDAALNSAPGASPQKKRFFSYSRETGICVCQHCGHAWKLDSTLQNLLKEEGQVIYCDKCTQYALVEEDDWEVFILEDVDVQIEEM